MADSNRRSFLQTSGRERAPMLTAKVISREALRRRFSEFTRLAITDCQFLIEHILFAIGDRLAVFKNRTNM
jgi:hypothetical protein